MAGKGKNHSKLAEQENVRKKNHSIKDLKNNKKNTGLCEFSKRKNIKNKIKKKKQEKEKILKKASFTTKFKDKAGWL